MRSAIFVVATVFSVTAGAQELTGLPGKWNGTMTSSSGAPTNVQLNVEESSAIFRVLDRAKNNPCASLERPATLTPGKAPEDVVLHVESGAIASCAAWSLRMKRVDDKTLEGAFSTGAVLHLTR